MSALAAVTAEAGKLPAFIRRDLLIARSQRRAIARDVALLAAQLAIFACIGTLVDPAVLPAYGDGTTGYMEFVAIGIVLSLAVGLAIVRVAGALRREQTRGTLVALVTTPSSMGTVQLGSVAFDLVWVPLRVGVFLTAVALLLGLEFDAAGVPAAAVLVLAVLPLAWGLGLLGAAVILVLRRGVPSARLVVAVLAVVSGAYFPLTLLPDSVESIAELNPMARALDGIRSALLGGSTDLGHELLRLLLPSVVLLIAGSIAFSLALARERRHGAFAP
jgi:ABC-2 type transport system permease protein